ncbi:MAG: glycosyltransferase family 4 protein [Actinomycetota bacterium]
MIRETRMLVTHVAPTAFGSDGLYGGGERYPSELCRALARHVSCRLVTFGRRLSHERIDGLDVVKLPTITHLKGHPAHPIARGLGAATDGADVVHMHHMRSAPSRLGALTARRRRQHLVVTDHGLGGGGWGGMLPRMFDRFLVVSQYSAQMLAAPPARTRVIYGGADPDRFRPGDERRAGILFVGRMTPHKGLDVLLRAATTEMPVTVAGTRGHDRGEPERSYPKLLERLATGKEVSLVGAVPESELPALYRRAAVFVLPSLHDTCYGRHVAISELLGLSLIEAMASGTPVVCSRIGGTPEIVRDGETGYLIEPGDEEGLRARLEELLGNRRVARRMGEAARALVLESFTWEHTARRCLAAYGELSASGAA